MSDQECLELKNIKYKTMLLNGNNKQFNLSKSDHVSIIDAYLENETKHNKNETWSKLNKTERIKKIKLFVEDYNKNSKDKNYTDEQLGQLLEYLTECLNRKRLSRVKDVVYENGEIKSINNLYFNKSKKKFTIKRGDRRVSTLKSLHIPNKKKKKKRKGDKNKKLSDKNGNKLDVHDDSGKK